MRHSWQRAGQWGVGQWPRCERWWGWWCPGLGTSQRLSGWTVWEFKGIGRILRSLLVRFEFTAERSGPHGELGVVLSTQLIGNATSQVCVGCGHQEDSAEERGCSKS